MTINQGRLSMRTACKVDNNHSEIVKQFRALGMSVIDTSNVGDGFTDVVVGCFNLTVLVEIKDGVKKKNQLTKKQVDFHGEFKGAKVIVYKVEQCLDLYISMRNMANKIGRVSDFLKLGD